MRGRPIDVITGDEPEEATTALELWIALMEGRIGCRPLRHNGRNSSAARV